MSAPGDVRIAQSELRAYHGDPALKPRIVRHRAQTRREREAIAHRLWAEGLKVREIAERLGVAFSTAGSYLSDPGGLRLKERKRSYARPCPVCGGPTDGSHGRKHQVEICQQCRTWTREEILNALRAWSETYGQPPTMREWRRAGDGHPAGSTVRHVFGLWNEALIAAGLPLCILCG